MKTKNYYTVILRSDSDEESFEDSSLRSEVYQVILIKIITDRQILLSAGLFFYLSDMLKAWNFVSVYINKLIEH